MPPVGDAVDRATTLGAVRRRLFDAPTEVPLLSRHVLLRKLGAGGSGVVYEAYDPELDRKVAIKLLQARSKRDDSTGQARLKREAQAMARISHPNVIAVYDVGTYDEPEAASLLATIRGRDAEIAIPTRGVFVVMELVPGASLRAWLATQPTLAEMLEVFVQAGRGLAAAHAEGLIHRDFKPDNVLVGSSVPGALPRVRVLDFGLARATDRAPRSDPPEGTEPGPSIHTPVTQSGAVHGTPAYMSPEQHTGVAADPRSDQYNFCVTLWEALAGTRPFRADTMEAMVKLKRDGPPAWPPGTSVSDRLWRILTKGLDPNPQLRFATMNALLTELERRPLATLRRGALAAVVLGSVAIAGVSLGRAPQPPCQGAAQAIDEAWSVGRQSELSDRMQQLDPERGASLWQGTQQRLTQYADQWRALRTQMCHDARRPLDDDARLKVEASVLCLERRRSDFAVTVKVLSSLQQVADAQRVVEGLGAVEACRDTNIALEPSLPPPGPERIEAIDISSLVVESDLHERAGQARQARDTATLALQRARALAHPPTLARALNHQGLLRWNEDQHDDALALFTEAAVMAERAGDRAVSLQAQISSANLLSKGLQRHDEAARVLDLVEARASRMGDSSPFIAELARSRGLMLMRRGQFLEAESEFVRALNLREAAADEPTLSVASSLVPLAAARQRLGKVDEALAALDRALQIRRDIVGEGPGDAMILNNRGTVLWRLSRFEDACASYGEARELFVLLHGPVHSNVAMVDNNLGTCASWREDYAGALAIHRRSLAAKLEQLGPSHPDLGYSYANIARAQLEVATLDEAEESFSQALRLWTKGLAPDHPLVAEPVAGLAEIALRRGALDEAKRGFERALALIGDAELRDLETQIRFGLAQTMAVTDLPRAAAMVQAVAQSPSIAADPGLRRRVDRWLAEHT